MPTIKDEDLDRPIYGAKAIAIAAGLVDADGNPDTRKAFYGLEKGYIDADKYGKKTWRTTLRRVLGRPREDRVK